MNSFLFTANESFILFEEIKGYITTLSENYHNTLITKLNNNQANILKSAIIYFNSSNTTLFEIKKYNYPFLTRGNINNIHYEYYPRR